MNQPQAELANSPKPSKLSKFKLETIVTYIFCNGFFTPKNVKSTPSKQANLIPSQGGTMEIGTEAKPFLHRVAWCSCRGLILKNEGWEMSFLLARPICLENRQKGNYYWRHPVFHWTMSIGGRVALNNFHFREVYYGLLRRTSISGVYSIICAKLECTLQFQ